MANGDCTLCGKRPATRSAVAQGHSWCHLCATDIAAERKHKRERRSWWKRAVRYAVWRGIGVAFMPNGNGKFTPKPLPASVLAKLPAQKTINLDKYCPGYTREQVKSFKAAIKAANFAVA